MWIVMFVGARSSFAEDAGEPSKAPSKAPSKERSDRKASKKGNALERLTSKELETLKQRIPNWDRLDAVKQERIAKNVLHLRRMSSEERDRFVRRMKTWRERTHERRGPQPSMREMRGSFEIARAFGHRLTSTLPDSTRARWMKSKLPPPLVHMAAWREFQSRARGNLLERVTKTGMESVDLAALPLSRRNAWVAAKTKLDELESAAASENGERRPSKELRRARHVVSRMLWSLESRRVAKFVKEQGEVPGAKTKTSRAMRTAEAWIQRFPRAYAQTKERLERGASDLIQKMHEHRKHRRGASGALRKGPLDRSARAQLVLLLDRVAQFELKDQPERRASVDRWIRELLVEHFGVPREEAASLPKWGAPAGARGKAMAVLVKKYVLPAMRSRGGHEGRRGHGRRGGPRGPRKGDRPSKSDASDGSKAGRGSKGPGKRPEERGASEGDSK